MNEQPVKIVNLPAVLKRCLESLVVEQKPAPQEPSLGRALETLRLLARDIGTVRSVAERRSDPDPEHRNMLARLDQWRGGILTVIDALPETVPYWSPRALAPQEPSDKPPSECVSYCRHDADTTKARCAWCKPTVWQEPSADTLQAVRALYRDDRDAMAAALIQMRADLAEARRER